MPIFFFGTLLFYTFLTIITLMATGYVKSGRTLTGVTLYAFNLRERFKVGHPARTLTLLGLGIIPPLVVLFTMNAFSIVVWAVPFTAYMLSLKSFSAQCELHQVRPISTVPGTPPPLTTDAAQAELNRQATANAASGDKPELH